MREFVVPDGMARSVFENKYSRRKPDGAFQTWAERVREVVAGSFTMDPRMHCGEGLLRRQALEEQAAVERLAVAGIMAFSGRHLQHGDMDQPGKRGELFTNCSTAMFSFMLFQLLLRGCFRAGTPVKLANGVRIPIEQVHEGDVVVSFDADTNTFTVNKVTALHTNEPKEMVRITFEDGSSVVCTEDHVFYLDDNTECCAADLLGKSVKQHER